MIVRSKTRGRRRSRATALAASAGALFFAQGSAMTLAQPAGEARRAASGVIEEVVVTARKREQDLQTVPIAVSTFSGEALSESGITETTQLGQAVPNLSVFESNAGLGVTLRGQTLNEGLISEDPSVNLTLDGVYIARPHAGVIPFVDVAQVEILRGPQGTLFGRNTTGGAINITTRLPEYVWSGEIGATGGNAGRRDLWASVNAPLIENRLAVRGAVKVQNADGFDRGVFNDDRIYDDDEQSFFGSMLWEPTDDLEIVFRGDYSEADENFAELTHLINIDPVGTGGGRSLLETVLFVGTGGTMTAADAFEQFGVPHTRDLPLRTTEGAPSSRVNETYGISATATWNPAAAPLTVKGIVSRRWLEQATLFDLDGMPYRILSSQQLLDHEQTTAELQLFGSTELFERNMDWIVGAFYFEEEALQGSTSDTLADLQPSPLNLNNISGRGENDSIAGFAEVDLEVVPNVRINAGARYTVDTKYASNRNSAGYFSSRAAAEAFAGGAVVFELTDAWMDMFPDGRVNQLDIGGVTESDVFTICRVPPDQFETPGVCLTENEDEFDEFSWNFGVDWLAWERGNSAAFLYANVKRSFRSGGQNFRSTFTDNAFDPEFVTQYAVGAKLGLLEGNLRLNTEAFYQDVEDKQVITVVAAAGSGLGTVISNAASATVQGLEMELTWLPAPDVLPGLQLAGGFGWTDAEYDSFPDMQPSDPSLPLGPQNPLVQIDRSDEPFVRVAEWSGNASVSYAQPVLDQYAGNLLLRLDWSYKSDTPLEEGTGGGVPAFSTGAYDLLNARAALTFWNDQVEIGLWCHNCTDERYVDAALDLRNSLGFALAQPSRPRTYGADFTYRFGQ